MTVLIIVVIFALGLGFGVLLSIPLWEFLLCDRW